MAIILESLLTRERVPPNCRFEIDDAEDDWTFSQQFDYIHGRALATCFADPASVIRQAFSALAPGGYLELQDGVLPIQYIGDAPTDSTIYKWQELLLEAAAKAGRRMNNVQHYKKWFQEAGFVDVEERKHYWPINSWPKNKRLKQIGMWFMVDLLDAVEGMSMSLFTKILGWSREEVEVLLAGVRNDLKDRSIHGYIVM